MKLPHGKILLFAKEVTHKTDQLVDVHCKFGMIPSLPMFLEAAAQCTAGFDTKLEVKLAFLTLGKELKLLEEIVQVEYTFRVYKETQLGQYGQFRFEVREIACSEKIAIGAFTLKIEI